VSSKDNSTTTAAIAPTVDEGGGTYKTLRSLKESSDATPSRRQQQQAGKSICRHTKSSLVEHRTCHDVYPHRSRRCT
jgi:hypothetical protein